MNKEQQEKYKILYVITKASFGGAQKYVLDLSSHFKSKGHDVIVVHGKNEFEGSNIFISKLASEGIKTIELSSLGRDIKVWGDIKTFFALIRLFFEEKPNIVHLNSSKVGAIGAFAVRVRNTINYKLSTINSVYTAHGLPHNEQRPLWQKIILKISTWLTFIFVHKVIVVADKELKEVENWWGVGKKITRIYNGVGEIEFTPRAQARAELSERIKVQLENKLVIGSIAELTKNKGLLEFLPILQKLKEKYPDFIYLHFGTGELAKDLKQKATRLNLATHIFWLGFDKKAGTYLKAFDIFTLPSLKEGLPYALLEAGSAGVAVAASNVGGIPEIIKHGETGLTFSPHTTEEVVSALLRLTSDEQLREQYGNALNAHIQKVFSLESMLKQTAETYYAL